MGYTHYWSIPLEDPGYTEAWPTILADTRRIIAAARANGVAVAGPQGHGDPILDEKGIAFNGDTAADLDHETFTLAGPATAAPAHPVWFCKTGWRPYDLAVTSVLLRCRLLLPGLFRIGSDGDWDREWRYGVNPWSSGQSARSLIADLFGPVPADTLLEQLR